jgi:arginyl-tRNA synthetase
LIQFPKEIEKSAKEYNPLKALSATYEIARAFNQFYNAHPVLQAKNESLISARLKLIEATAITIKKGLDLLGIEVMEKM